MWKQRCNIIVISILIVLFIAAGCAPVSTPSAVPTVSPSPSDGTATVLVTRGTVYVSQGEQELAPVEVAADLQQGQRLMTLPDSRAEVRLDTGTRIRLGENTGVGFPALGNDSHLTLEQGQVWVILSAGTLKVETPSGTAGVSGSYLGVTYDAGTQALTATCLEGTCSLENDAGITALSSGQAADLQSGGSSAAVARQMTVAEVDAWVEENPDSASAAGRPEPAVDAAQAMTLSPSLPGIGDSSLEWVPYYFENNCSTDYSNLGYMWYWDFRSILVEGEDPVEGTIGITVLAGEIRSGVLPRLGYALIKETVGAHLQGQFGLSDHTWTNVAAEEMDPYYIVLCPDMPRLPAGSPGYPTATQQPSAPAYQPIPYYFGNNCFHADTETRNHTLWHWTFRSVAAPNGAAPSSPVDVEIVIPPGEARTGELPGGYYEVRDWTEDGSVNHDAYQDKPTTFMVNLCPDEPALPGAPAGEPTPSYTVIPPAVPPQQTLTYNYSFPCSDYGITRMHVLFVGTETLHLELEKGDSLSGSLPPGQYQIFTWMEGGTVWKDAGSRFVDTATQTTISFDSCQVFRTPPQ